ncbi:hypothetical protein PH551_22890 [Rhizobium sp. CNPSo 3490]|nr:hypothetical protein [Rhizobium sp. CNPSo 3490]MDK4735391.1 hypothetical protein [Rhizobium sp. CNPSo 3490]
MSMRNGSRSVRNPYHIQPLSNFFDAALHVAEEAKMTTACDENVIQLKPISTCRREVEVAMVEMLVSLQKRGWSAAELALTLADASEDLVMLIATKELRAH